MARTGAAVVSGLDDAITRAEAYEGTGVDALFFTGVKTCAELETISAATTLPIVLGGFPEELIDRDLRTSGCGLHCKGTRRLPPRRKRSTRRLKRYATAGRPQI
jgi:2-methylisocitrate lyase-like PEP mutase family enzyme